MMRPVYPIMESIGYVVSMVSVLLLAITAWTGAKGDPPLRIAVIAGAALAVVGMALRWYVWWRRHGRRKGNKS